MLSIVLQGWRFVLYPMTVPIFFYSPYKHILPLSLPFCWWWYSILRGKDYSEWPTCNALLCLATVPLIKTSVEIWYADDVATCGQISASKAWWNQVVSLGPFFGYYPNANKTWLITKPQFNSLGKIFGDTAVNVTSEGRPYLGAPIGKPKCLLSTKLTTGFWRLIPYLPLLPPNLMLLMLASPMDSLADDYMYHVPLQMSSHVKHLEAVLLVKFIPALTGFDPPGELLTFCSPHLIWWSRYCNTQFKYSASLYYYSTPLITDFVTRF